MILDDLKNAKKYYGINVKFKIALLFLRENDFNKMGEGKYARLI